MKNFLYLGVIGILVSSCGGAEETKPITQPTENITTVEPTNGSTSKNTYSKDYTALNEKARLFFGELPKNAENPENPLTEEKVILGQTLYFDKILSKDKTQSCNTCHNLNTYGVDNQSFSAGNDGGLGGRNSPTTLNAALHMAQFWDGREPDVEAQAGGPVLNPVEMAMASEADVEERLSDSDKYIDLFDAAFPLDENPISYENMKKAIGAFERMLVTPSRFDEYIAGNNNALTDQEMQGMETFIEVGCTTCHMGALLGGSMYQKFGVHSEYWKATKSEKVDNGRFDLTGNEADKYFFKVPSLRNIAKTNPYFHDGSIDSLEEAISIMAKVQLNKELTPEELSNMVAFMESLTGEVEEKYRNEI
ncbi:MAG: cytochrome-c peroxidase [Salibacteraceae bacterium]